MVHQMSSADTLKQVSQIAAATRFKPNQVTEENRHRRELEALGMEIAALTGNNLADILTVTVAALEAANIDDLAKALALYREIGI